MIDPNVPKLGIALATSVVSATLVALTRRFALSRGMVDVPGNRSSHTLPTPRGGGIAILIALSIGFLVTYSAGLVHLEHRWIAAALSLAIGSVAAIGWLDDHKNVSIPIRLVVHVAASLLCALTLSSQEHWHSWTLLVAIAWWSLCGVAAINVTNFMDGTDGLVGSAVMIYSGYVFLVAPSGSALALTSLLLSAGCAGFLAWNWPPAKIFMGDVGSGSLGLLTAIEGIALVQQTHQSFVAAFLPLLPIYFDAGVTLLGRIRRREDLGTPHRRHLYQRLANSGWGHTKVAMLYSAAILLGAVVGRYAARSLTAVLLYTFTVLVVGAILDRGLSIGQDANCTPI